MRRSLRRATVVAEMQARELLRRRTAIVMLLALPLALYGALAGTSPQIASAAAGVGLGWSVAGAALFSVLASRRVDPRLVLVGFRPFELLLGRLLFLLAFSMVLVGAFSALISEASNAAHPWALALGIGLTTVVAVPLGLALAALLPRELEGTLALIGVVGIQLALPVTATLAAFLPLYGPLRLIEGSLANGGAVAVPSLHALGFAAGFLALAVALWARRVRARAHVPVPVETP